MTIPEELKIELEDAVIDCIEKLPKIKNVITIYVVDNDNFDSEFVNYWLGYARATRDFVGHCYGIDDLCLALEKTRAYLREKGK